MNISFAIFKMNKFLPLAILLLFTSYVFGQANLTAPVANMASTADKYVKDAGKYVAKINAAVAKVESSGLYKSLVDGNSVTFPFGILPNSGDKNYALIVDSIKLDPVKGMIATIFMKIPIGSDKSLYFLADAVPFSKDGSMSGDFKLYLLKTEKFSVGSGYDIQINGLGKGSGDSTYVTFDCKGFKNVTLNGKVNFNPATIVKHNENESAPRDTFSLNYYVQADRVANMILTFKNVPPFQFKSLPGFKCTIPELTFDKSDVRNAPAFQLPTWYVDSLRKRGSDTDLSMLNSVLWEGIYIPTITIEIPKSFREGSADAQKIMTVSSKDIIIDQFGISALTQVASQVANTPLFEAKIKGFKINVKYFEVNIISNQLSRAGIFGGMSFPVCKEESTIDFGLVMSKQMDKDYLDFWGYADWKTAKPLNANAFGLAQMTLNGASIAFEYTNKQFFPSIDIDGDVVIMPKSTTATTPIGTFGFDFGHLIISARSPYVDLGGQSVNFTPDAAIISAMANAQTIVKSGQNIANTTTSVANGSTSISNGASSVKDDLNTGTTAADNITGGNSNGTLTNAIDKGTQVVNDGIDKGTAIVNAGIDKATDAANKVTTGFFKLKEGIESKMAKLPISISGFELKKETTSGRFGLAMTVNVKLQGSKSDDAKSSNGFGGSAGFTIWAKRSAATSRWGYAGFDLNKVIVAVQQGSFSLNGQLTMFDGDSVYGKGFCGQLELKVVDKITVKAGAIFGKLTTETQQDSIALKNVLVSGTKLQINDVSEDQSVRSTGATVYRYWFVDAMAEFPGLPIAPGVEINSFTGGMYHNMKMLKKPTILTGTKVDCKTASGRQFIPDNSIYLGLLAGIGLQSTGGGNAFNGNINFGLQFGNNGGLLSLATWGNVGFFSTDFKAPGLTKVASAMSSAPLKPATKDSVKQTPPPPTSSSVTANWFVEYDVPQKTFVGDFQIYMNLAGVITGGHAGNRAGTISIYSSPQKWYVYVGQPSDQISIDVLKLAKASSYLCLGSVLPTPPIAPLPPEVKPKINIDYNLLAMGSGLSFGARLAIEGKPSVNLFLCNAKVEIPFKFGAGFDVLISKSQEPIYCTNLGGSERGINGWYATGQAFIYGSADLKVSYGCWYFGSGNYTLLSMFFNAYIFAQLPRPTFVKGELEAGFSVLKKSFRKSFDVKLGDQCETNSLANDVNFIEYITPNDSARDISVSEKIEVYYSNPIEKFTYSIDGGKGNEIYRVVLDESNCKLSSKGINIPFTLTWAEDKKMMTITPNKTMPEVSKIDLIVSLVTQRQLADKSWVNTTKFERDTILFYTRKEPDTISVTDVLYSYPLPSMANFYKDETTTGFIKLASIPSKAMKLNADYQFDVVIFENTVEVGRTRNVTVNNTLGQNNFVFTIPNSRMEVGKNYIFKLVKSPRYNNAQQTSTTTGNVTAGTMTSVAKDSVVLQYRFSTSKYSTYRDKMSYYGVSFAEILTGVTQLNLSVNKAKTIGSNFESLSNYESDGYYWNGTKTANELIKVGKIDYNNSLLNSIQTVGSSIVNVVNSGSISTISTAIDEVSNLLKDINLTCLISGGCTAEQVQQVTIPKGNLSVPIGYYLPGTSTPTSVFPVTINLNNDLKIPVK